MSPELAASLAAAGGVLVTLIVMGALRGRGGGATLGRRVEQLDELSRRLMRFEQALTVPAPARRVRRTAAGGVAGDLAAPVQLRHPGHPAGRRPGRRHGQAGPAVRGDRRQVSVRGR